MIRDFLKVTDKNFFATVFFLGTLVLSFILAPSYFSPTKRQPAADNYGGQFVKPVWRGEESLFELQHKTKIMGSEDTRRPVLDSNGRLRVSDTNLNKALNAVAALYSEDNGVWNYLGTAVLTENRSVLLTVAHTLIDEGQSKLGAGQNIDLSKLRIHFAACKGVLHAEKFVRGSDGYLSQIGRDIGIIILRDNVCAAVEPVKLATRKELTDEGLVGVGSRLVVAGIYSPEVIHQQRLKDLGGNSDPASGFTQGYESRVQRVYFDKCNLQAWRQWRDSSVSQTFIAHDCDTGTGGSGGAIFAAHKNKWYLLGVQWGFIKNNTYNLGLLAFDWIDILLREAIHSIGGRFPETQFPLGNSSARDVINFSI